MAGAEQTPAARSLSLRALTDYSSNVQFEGDGTAEYPPLYNRDVFGFFPFQVNADRFVIPVYVMTRNVAKVYGTGAGPSRFDLPPETYRLAIGGVDGTKTTASATDPITGASVPVEAVSSSGDEIVVEMKVTDSPRLLTLQEGAEPVDEAGTGNKPVGAAGANRVTAKPRARNAARLKLRGGRRLLRSRQLGVIARCDSQCSLRARGRLIVGGHGYGMSSLPGLEKLSNESRPEARARLGISHRTARLARRALGRGVAVRAKIVMATTDTGSGATETVRRVLALRH